MIRMRTVNRFIYWCLLAAALFPSGVAAVYAQEENASLVSPGSLWQAGPRSNAEIALSLALRQTDDRLLGNYTDPDEYVVGPGDRFTIMFTAQEIPEIKGEVGATGDLFLKSVGPVPVGQKLLGEAITAVREKVAQLYGGASFSVELSRIRFMRIVVSGYVVRPGIYYVPAAWRASEVLDLAGGLSRGATQRHIRLLGEKEKTVDLVRFNRLGDFTANPLIGSGHTLIVPSRDRMKGMITLAGEVATPSSFETRAGDELRDFLAFAGGAGSDSAAMLVIIRNNLAGTVDTLDAAVSATWGTALDASANITVIRKAESKERGMVSITGAVARPGTYPIRENPITIDALISMCGGMTPEGNPDLAQLYRSTRQPHPVGPEISMGPNGISAEQPEYLALSFDPRSGRTLMDIALMDGDSVFIPTRSGTVMVTGAVVAPGLVPFKSGSSAEYYIAQAGGLGYDADRSRMTVINPFTGAKIAAAQARRLFDGEILHIPQKEETSKP